MNPFLLAFIRGHSFTGANSDYERIRYSQLGATSGQNITVADGIELFVDSNTLTLGDIVVAPGGKLTFDPSKKVTFTAKSINVGATAWGVAAAADGMSPHAYGVQIILTGSRSIHTARPVNPETGVQQGWTNDGASRAINNHGTLYFRGIAKLLPQTKLAATVNAGATTCKVRGDCSDWSIGEDIVIAPTNLYGQSTSERRTLTGVSTYDSVNGWTVLTWASALGELHFGQKQYPIDAAYGANAMSLSPNTQHGGSLAFTPPDADTPTEFDSVAEVINVSNGNITIESLLDSDWSTYGFGVHVMNHPGSQYHLEGVRVIRGGQRGALGRYPFHSHHLSYADQVGTNITFDLTGSKIKVNWANHGIVANQVLIGTAVFSRDQFTPAGPNGALAVTLGGAAGTATTAEQNYWYDKVITFRAGTGTLPSNIIADKPYFLSRTSTPNVYFIATQFTQNVGQVGGVGWVNNGSGTVQANASSSNQPVAFTTTGTLPSGLAIGALNKPLAKFSGTRYFVLGSTITTNSFCIDVAPDSSLPGSGTHTGTYTQFTADHPECQIIKCVVDGSENRAYTTHGSCGTKIYDSIAYNIKGNAFFLEDGTEERNDYQRNFALKVRNPAEIDALKMFDTGIGSAAALFQSSGHWWVNLNNLFVDQYAADCEGSAVAQAPNSDGFDLSYLIACQPYLRPVRRWLNNGGHSNNKYGLVLNIGIDDQFGRSTTGLYGVVGSIDTNEIGYPSNLFEGGIAWKNNQGGYQNVESPKGPFYKKWTTGDNGTGDFQGAMNPATMSATSLLMIGYSNLPAQTSPVNIDLLGYSSWPRFGNATYHFTLTFTNVAYQNFPWARARYARGGQQDFGGGAVAWRDLYTMAIGLSRQFSINNRFNNTHPGHLTRADRYSGYPVTVTLGGTLVVSPKIVDVTTGEREFEVHEGAPVRFVRSSGALPSGGSLSETIVKDKVYYARNVKDKNGNAVSGVYTGVTWNLSVTPTGPLLNGTGASQSGNHGMMRLWRDPNVYWVRGMGSTMPDPDGSYVKSKTGVVPASGYQWVCPYGDNPFFANGARNLVMIDPDTTGTSYEGTDGQSFSTSDLFVGLQTLRTSEDYTGYEGRGMGMTITRVTPTTRTPIGTYKIDKMPTSTTGSYFPDFQTSALLNRRGDQTWFTIESGDFPDGTGRSVPLSYIAVNLVGAQDPASDMMLGFKLNSAPTSVYRTFAGNEVPSSPDGGPGRSVTCTQATGADLSAQLAAVAANSTGSLWAYDSVNKFVWVRHKPLPNNPTDLATEQAKPHSYPEAAFLPQWIVVKT